MIINFHPQELPSKKGLEIINALNVDGSHTVVHVNDKTVDEWKAIIKSDEKLLLVAPTYWWGLSYEFDKWAQNVLSYGFAYQYNASGTSEGLLNGRAFELYTTQGTPEAYATVLRANMKQRLEIGIFGFCGAKVDVSFYDATQTV